MVALSRDTRKALEALIRAGKPIPNFYFSVLGGNQLEQLVTLAIKVDNGAFISQVRSILKSPQFSRGNVTKPSTAKAKAKQVHFRIPLSTSERADFEYRISYEMDKYWRNRNGGRKVWVQFFEGGAPGLVQQK
jgi:hypothetical protein